MAKPALTFAFVCAPHPGSFSPNPTLSKLNGQRVTALTTPTAILSEAFGANSSDLPQNQADQKLILKQRANLIDTLLKPETLKASKLLAGEERVKLDAYLGSLEKMNNQLYAEQELDLSKCNKPTPAKSYGRKGNPNQIPVGSHGPALNFMIDAAVAALACGVSKVVTIGASPYFANGSMSGLPGGGGTDHHDLWHHAKDPAKWAKIEQRETWHVDQLHRLWEALKKQPAVNGTLADNTVIVWICDAGNTHHNGSDDLPALLIGKLGGKIKSDLVHSYRGGGGNTSMFWYTLANSMGVPLDSFGPNSQKILSFKA